MNSSGRRALAEGIGTYFLVLIGCGTVMVDAWSGGAVGHTGISLAFAFVVTGVIYAIGHVSGAHINPAVTLAFWSDGRFPAFDTVAYLVAQCLGAISASVTLGWILGDGGSFAATTPAVGVPQAFAAEFLLSFVLMFVITAVATDRRVADGFAGLAVGLTVGFCALLGGPLTGASMNPARSLGPAVAGGVWEAHWLYWAAPILGMLVAVRVYDVVRPVDAPDATRRGRMGVQGPI